MKYTKRPITIEAIQFTGENYDEIKNFAGEKCISTANKKHVIIDTLEGDMFGSIGDYIIKGVRGEFYPCKPDVFAKTYTEKTVCTNGDRIRQMSNMDLQKLFNGWGSCPHKDCPVINSEKDIDSDLFGLDGSCQQCWLDWLDKEVEE